MSREKIVLDCDPGVDDMFAIFAALRYCDLVGVTSVAGNVGIEHTTQNALDILQLAGADVPVHQGASAPLRSAMTDDASHVHGEGGLGGVSLPKANRGIASDNATQALFDLTSEGDVTVVAVGPLTNIALALQQDATWIDRVPRLVIMGGSTDSGNVTTYAEFNIWADPEAAKMVFESGVNITMAGLNLTRQVTMGQPSIAEMRASGSATGVIAADALDFYADFSLKEYGIKSSAMHDPCAVLEVARPDLFQRSDMHVEIETHGEFTRGMTVCDQRRNARPGNVKVMTTAAAAETVQLIVAAAIDPLAG